MPVTVNNIAVQMKNSIYSNVWKSQAGVRLG